LAGWLGTLKATPEGDGNLLDNSMIVYGAGLSDGNRHLHEDLPTLLIGRGGNYFKPGRRIIYRKETPMSNWHRVRRRSRESRRRAAGRRDAERSHRQNGSPTHLSQCFEVESRVRAAR